MRYAAFVRDRRGAVVPLVAVSLTALLGFVALAVDVGMMAVVRTQAQNAADAAAMAGARTLNGDPDVGYRVPDVLPNARAAATANRTGHTTISASQVAVQIGSYTYDLGQKRFVQNIPPDSTDTPNLVEATINATNPTSFAAVLGLGSFSTQTVATAVHRPRDVAVILDMSGSMRFDSLMGIPYAGTRTQSNNPETVYPNFGHYSSSSANLEKSSGPTTMSNNTYGLANLTVATDAGSALVKDYYRSALGASPVAAFSPAPDSYADNPAGDEPLYKYGSTSTYGTTVQQITNSMSVTFNGYTASPFTGYSGPTVKEFAGYTQGPRHWGKTFFIWPPDPRTGKDWRTLYFNMPGSSTGITDNRRLWNPSGNWNAPGSSTYQIDYTAILAWIKQTPNPFPPQLRAGRILYYDEIPDSIDTSRFPPSDPNERFWKEYIDHVLGVIQTSSSRYTEITDKTGYGDDYTWGTVKISAKPPGSGVKNYMYYADNPKRPRLHFWFGPMTMLDYLSNYNLVNEYSSFDFRDPGNSHSGPLWACKLGVQAAMLDIKNNHPNDFVSLMFFNRPQYSSNDGGTFNRPRVPLGRDYTRLIETLWFPPSTIGNPGTEIRCFDPENIEVPRASNGTCPVMGLMLAYNQLSGNASLRTHAPSPAPPGEAGGFGRNGAQKLVILETDGMANTAASASFTNAGPYNSYYKVRQPGEYPSNSGSDVPGQVYAVANRICALDTDSSPGYATPRKPVLIHCLAMGPIFEASSTNPDKADALDLLQNVQYIGSTQDSPSTPLANFKIITGTSAERMDKIRQAFSIIMQDGIQVSLIR